MMCCCVKDEASTPRRASTRLNAPRRASTPELWSDIPDIVYRTLPDIPDTDRTWFSDMIGHTIGHQSDIDRTLIGQYRTYRTQIGQPMR